MVESENMESKIQAKIKNLFEEYCLNKLQQAAAMKFVQERLADRDDHSVDRVRQWFMHKINEKTIPPPNPRQRGSPDIIPGLRASPWWDPSQFPFVEQIEEQYEEIKRELLQLYHHGGFEPYRGPSWASNILAPDFGSESHDSGEWNVFYLYLHGISFEENVAKCPVVENIIKNIIPRHYDHAFFSAVNPHTHIITHHGPTNKKLRLHLSVVGPEGSRLRAEDETRSFEEGKVFIFDDSFDHEAWHDGDSTRVNLIIDFWHPDLSDDEVKFLRLMENAKMRAEKLVSEEEEDTFFSVIEKAKELRPDDNSWWCLSEEDRKFLAAEEQKEEQKEEVENKAEIL